MDLKTRYGIDLINYNLSDLLRGQFMGDKATLISIYQKLQ